MNQTAALQSEPLWRELAGTDAFAVALQLAEEPGFLFLDSAMRNERVGRYSYVCCDPVAAPDANNVDQINTLLAAHRLRHVPGLPPFQGGLAGYIGYEFGQSIEPQLRARSPAPDIPPMQLKIYDCVLAFDHVLGKAWGISTGYPARDSATRHARAAERLDALLAKLGIPATPLSGHGTITAWTSNFTRANYEAAVRRTIAFILDGDIFQANISQQFTAAIPAGFNPLAFYARLRERNAAPFGAYLKFGDLVIASSSPERLISFDGAIAEARPIKGTRRRDPNPHADAALKADLLASRKDHAENVMIVDLLRNDLSKVCAPGAVDVPLLCGLESYATVHHLTSVVTGRLEPGRTPGDLLTACFPGGSITGAPKLRAMEIIAEIEQRPRNIYCGSIGFAGFSGRMDFNICIRTAMFHRGHVTLHGGGGITARSEPSAEYEETIAKVARILDVFGAEPPR